MSDVIYYMRLILNYIPWYIQESLTFIGLYIFVKKIYSWIYRLRHSYVRDGAGGWKKKYWFGVNRKFDKDI